MARRRALAVLTLLFAISLAGPGDPRHAPTARAASDGQFVTPAQAAAARVIALERARERREAARRAEARRLRRSTTVKGALRRAWLGRAISRARYTSCAARGGWLAATPVA